MFYNIFTNIKTFLFSLRQKRPCGTGRRSMLRMRSRWRRWCQGWCGGCPEQSSDPGRRQRWRVSAAVLGWSLTPFLEWTDNVYWQLRIKTLQYSLQIIFVFLFLYIYFLKQRMLMCVCNWTNSTYIPPKKLKCGSSENELKLFRYLLCFNLLLMQIKCRELQNFVALIRINLPSISTSKLKSEKEMF